MRWVSSFLVRPSSEEPYLSLPMTDPGSGESLPIMATDADEDDEEDTEADNIGIVTSSA
jgi:hypothetical protein